jgi:hypothetical protein
MDLGPIEATRAVDKALAAWATVLEAIDANAAGPLGGIAQALDAATASPVGALHALDPAAASPLAASGGTETPRADPGHPVSEPALPGADADVGHESALLQTLSRPPQSAATTAQALSHAADPRLPAVGGVPGDFALPSSLLAPATLVGLQVEPALGWPLPYHGEAPTRREPRDERRRDETPDAGDDEDDAAPAPPPAAAAPPPRAGDAPGSFDSARDAAWCDALTQALRVELSARIVPASLLAAAEQWRRGRCVVLACPQGADPAGLAWAFVLWPRSPMADGHPGTLAANEQAGAPARAGSERLGSGPAALYGLRVDARLHWRSLPPSLAWCHVRVIKEHHPRRGRQLVSPDSANAEPGVAPPPCEVQLGPVLAHSLRWCEVRLQIQAAQRFWAALGKQWSAHVVVCARPLLAARATREEATRC